jgi:hypothetical protein
VDAKSNILDGYVTRQQLADCLRKSERTIDRWEWLRIGPPRTVIGKTILYRTDSVRQWLAGRERRTFSRAPITRK